jgi:hypothetical protein
VWEVIEESTPNAAENVDNYNLDSYNFNNSREIYLFLDFSGSFFVGNGKNKKWVVKLQKMM